MIMDRQDSSTVAVPPQHSPSIKQESPKSIAPPVKRKRVRIPKSCIPCLRGKRACDRERPACGRCVRAGQAVECSYDSRLETISSHRSKKLKGEKNDDSDDSSDQESHEILKLRQQLRASEQIVKELQMQLERGRLGSSDMRRASGSDTRRQRSPNYSPEQSHPRSVSHLEEHSKALQGPSPSDGLLMLAEISRSERASEMYRQASSSSSSWNVGHHSTSATAARNSEWPVETTPRSANGAYLARIRASSGTVDANTNSRGRNSLSPSTERSGTPVEDVKSPRNMNGQHIYFGDGAANYPALREL
ncbi:hypothetical protein IE53DRAFT_95166 [Violaceomyces palustris]|uniref:Uncharacterized protein n=1 Tax=Violaceomyces palustris TaxID=1673888 RepID=A0ACD0NXC9_9BASI|nr:hypothetical protein IE53DRAFT_95166 [Violaceomyces palustris]